MANSILHKFPLEILKEILKFTDDFASILLVDKALSKLVKQHWFDQAINTSATLYSPIKEITEAEKKLKIPSKIIFIHQVKFLHSQAEILDASEKRRQEQHLKRLKKIEDAHVHFIAKVQKSVRKEISKHPYKFCTDTKAPPVLINFGRMDWECKNYRKLAEKINERLTFLIKKVSIKKTKEKNLANFIEDFIEFQCRKYAKDKNISIDINWLKLSTDTLSTKERILNENEFQINHLAKENFIRFLKDEAKVINQPAADGSIEEGDIEKIANAYFECYFPEERE